MNEERQLTPAEACPEPPSRADGTISTPAAGPGPGCLAGRHTASPMCASTWLLGTFARALDRSRHRGQRERTPRLL